MTKQKPPTRAPSPLERLGIYRVESLLGRGGMGEVYLAWDEVLERHVAIKLRKILHGAPDHQVGS